MAAAPAAMGARAERGLRLSSDSARALGDGDALSGLRVVGCVLGARAGSTGATDAEAAVSGGRGADGASASAVRCSSPSTPEARLADQREISFRCCLIRERTSANVACASSRARRTVYERTSSMMLSMMLRCLERRIYLSLKSKLVCTVPWKDAQATSPTRLKTKTETNGTSYSTCTCNRQERVHVHVLWFKEC